MGRILVTGMSGTGKSSALERLELLGFRTVDTDEGDWTEWCTHEIDATQALSDVVTQLAELGAPTGRVGSLVASPAPASR